MKIRSIYLYIFLHIYSAQNTVGHTGYAGSYERINVSTKQSDKIAQISKNIEKQVSQSYHAFSLSLK
jgi:hypothetical protein